ncbi:hypothetical protein EI94DRAFT_1750471, partial [Lactarius quietus]
MPQRASIRQFTRTVTYASIARLSSDITSATRRMLSQRLPRKYEGERDSLESFGCDAHHAAQAARPTWGYFVQGAAYARLSTQRFTARDLRLRLPSPITPPARRLRPSSVRLARLPIPPRAGEDLATPPSTSALRCLCSPPSIPIPPTPTSGRGNQHQWSSPRSPLSGKSSRIGLDSIKNLNQCNEEETLISAFRNLHVAGHDVPALFSTTSPLAKMVQQAREEHSSTKGKHLPPTTRVQHVSEVSDLRVAQTTIAPEVEPQIARCIGAARSDASEFASGHTAVRAGPRRQPNERLARPHSTPPSEVYAPDENQIDPVRITGKAKVASPPATSLGIPGGSTGGGLVRSNTTGNV